MLTTLSYIGVRGDAMTFEVIKREDGRYGWQLRDEQGDVVKLPKPGRIHLPDDPAADERARQALQTVLRSWAEHGIPPLGA
ncbi:hypothetical protein [Sphingomonas sp.]|uniref:hypothetical protein n=1 Tax=Sphingomonas sp. TaxID=28214 RepID=UPI0035BBBEE0